MGEDVRTWDVATDDSAPNEGRWIKTDGGLVVRYDGTLTPYSEEVHDALDDPAKPVVAMKGPARGSKTISAENKLLSIGKYGPSRNVLWYMHSEPDVKRYVEERVKFFLDRHLRDKLANTKNPAWNLRTVDGMLWEWLPANASTTRARSASFIVYDEIDAMRPAIRDAALTLIENRQREYGSQRKAFVCSHPDAGAGAGINKILKDSDMRVRLWTCPDCAHLIGPAAEVPRGRRAVWNMAELMKNADDMPRDELLDMVAECARIICPFCSCSIDNTVRLQLEQHAGKPWFATKGMTIDEYENVEGEPDPTDIAGFVLHAFNAPFVTIGALAREFASAKLDSHTAEGRRALNEVIVKSLGETNTEGSAGAKPRVPAEIRARLQDNYLLGEVPDGVEFITSMVDVQVDRFEVISIGWNRNKESWLIDRYNLKQRGGLEEVRPAEDLKSWNAIVPGVFRQSYPLKRDPSLHLPIAKVAIDNNGLPGVYRNSLVWAGNLMASGMPTWKLLLIKGDAHIKGELFGAPRKKEDDDAGRPLAAPVFVRTINVFEVKELIAARMEIDTPGPGMMHIPVNLTDRHLRELTSETLINGVWVPSGRNETWDGWVGNEVARALLAPESARIDWEKPPIWARPFHPSPESSAPHDNDMPRNEPEFFSRLRALNKGRRRR